MWKLLTQVFGSRNQRLVKELSRTVAAVNALEAGLSTVPDEQFPEKTRELKARFAAGTGKPSAGRGGAGAAAMETSWADRSRAAVNSTNASLSSSRRIGLRKYRSAPCKRASVWMSVSKRNEQTMIPSLG